MVNVYNLALLVADSLVSDEVYSWKVRKIVTKRTSEGPGLYFKSHTYQFNNIGATRPLRTEFPRAGFHVNSYGNRGSAIFEDETDASPPLQLLGDALQSFDANVLASCLITNSIKRPQPSQS